MNVKCIETGKVYCSTTKAGEGTSVSQSHVSYSCRTNRPAKGLHFEYTDEEITELSICICGKKFIPRNNHDNYCSPECRSLAMRRKTQPEMPFTDDTNIMIVADHVRGRSMDRMAEAINKTTAEVYAHLKLLMDNGEYGRIKRCFNTQYRSVGVSNIDKPVKWTRSRR